MLDLDIIKLVSQNYSSRRCVIPAVVVLHYSAGLDAEGTVRWLQQKEARASYHFVISRSGKVWRLVAPSRAAWHCGKAEVPVANYMTSEANRITLGFCLANAGLLHREGDKWLIPRKTFDKSRWPVYPKRYAEPLEATLAFDSALIPKVTGYWEPYTEEQLKVLDILLKAQGAHKLARVGHNELAMPLGRKLDPGPLLPDQFLLPRPLLWKDHYRAYRLD